MLRIAQLFLFVSCTSFSLALCAYSSYGLSCKNYLERRSEDQEKDTLNNTAFIHAYLSGYLTAGNMQKGLVSDSANDVSINIRKMVQWLDTKFLELGETKVAVALETFWVESANAKPILQQRNQPE